MAKKGLGKGLDALIPNQSELEEKNNIVNIKISKLEPNKNQPRTNFEKETIDSLAESIKEHGLIQPIIAVKNGDMYKIVAGERRWRAAKKAGLKEIPAVIREYTEPEIAQIALIENLQRENLNPIEEASGYQTLISKFNMTQEDVSLKIGKSRSAIANSIRLLSLDEPIRDKLISGEISSGHARALLSLENSELRLTVLKSVLEKELNVRQTEALAKRLSNTKKKPDISARDEQLEAEFEIIENRLTSHFGTKVKLLHKGERGKIEIEYFTMEDLDRILNMLEKQ